MFGGAGASLYYVDNGSDAVFDFATGDGDRVLTSASYTLTAGSSIELFTTTSAAGTTAMTLTGNAVGQTIFGNAGANVLNGGGGTDTLNGLGGNDRYFVDSVGDVVNEAPSAGSDTVLTSVSYTLKANQHIEVFATTSSALTGAINLIGNNLAQTIVGNAGANTLNGAAGADLMRGLAGSDTYVIDNAGDIADESVAGSSGTDRVLSSIGFSLSDTVHAKGAIENLTLIGTAAVNGRGNTLANTLVGNGAANLLNGWLGSDAMFGGAGNDIFRFDTALNAATNVDRITDFDLDAPSVVDSFDTIQLENSIFTLLTPAADLAASRFARVTNAADFDNGSTITYVSSTGGLYYDTNGATAGGATLFARLNTGLLLTNVDFAVT